MAHPAQEPTDPVTVNPELHPTPVLPDASELNSLLSDVRAELSSDVFGNFRIEGAKSTNDPRHAGLGLVVKLMEKLEATTAAMEKFTSTSPPETAVETKKPGRANNNVLATIRNAVEQQLEGPIRDMRIEIDRLKSESGAIKKELHDIRAQHIKSAKRDGVEQRSGAATESSNVARKIKAFETKQSAALGGLRAEIEGIRSLTEAMNNKQRFATREAQALETRVDECERVGSTQRDDHNRLVSAHISLLDRVTDMEEGPAARDAPGDQHSKSTMFINDAGDLCEALPFRVSRMWVVPSQTK